MTRMTVSITRCSKKWLERILLLLCWAWLGTALAGQIEPKHAGLQPDEQGQALTSEFVVHLGTRLEEAVGRGVPLHFRYEYELARKRWYWADEHVGGKVVEYRLSYHALTRQYRVSQGTSQRNFESLDDALATLGRPARLHAIDRNWLVPGETYRVAVRLSLDQNQLPKPLQVDALADRDWRIEAKTLRWEFVAPAAGQ